MTEQPLVAVEDRIERFATKRGDASKEMELPGTLLDRPPTMRRIKKDGDVPQLQQAKRGRAGDTRCGETVHPVFEHPVDVEREHHPRLAHPLEVETVGQPLMDHLSAA